MFVLRYALAMRLTKHQKTTIKHTAAELFGPDAVVWLFGSRIDDNLRGGDIDLFVEIKGSMVDLTAKIRRLNTCLQQRLGEQKIDIISWQQGDVLLPIHQQAKKTGMIL